MRASGMSWPPSGARSSIPWGTAPHCCACDCYLRNSPKTVQIFAGHSSLQVTMDIYGHLFPSDVHKKAMGGIAGG